MSEEYFEHLQDATKLGNHLQPLINQFFKMNRSLQAMTNAYQVVIDKVSTLEEKSDAHKRKNEMLNLENIELRKLVENLTARVVEENEKRCIEVAASKVDDLIHANDEKISTLEMNYKKLESEMLKTKISEGKKEYVQVEVFNTEIERIKRDLHLSQKFTGGEVMPYNNSNPMDYIRQVEEKTLEVERTLNILSVHHSELELQLQASLASTHNGAFLWRIPEMRRRIHDAKIGRITSIYSPPFYTGRNGYKMCIRAYLNGDGSGEGTHLSIFFVIMKGEYDPLLQWPFDHKVSLVLVDQDLKKHLVQTFKPNLQSNSFQRPKSDMNVASGCPEFAKLSVLDDPSYVKDDIMYIKAIVDTSKILYP